MSKYEKKKKELAGKHTPTPRDMTRRAKMIERHPNLKMSDFEGGWQKNK